MKTYIIGHTKPDTDAVVAAMAQQYFEENLPAQRASSPEAVIADPLNPETTFLFEKFGVQAPRLITAADIAEEDRVILVDHNEETQRLAGLNPDQIIGIFDHHKVSLSLSSPIALSFMPWGSTSTLIYFVMKKNSIVPDKTLASLMLCAILSDTVGYKSATTTEIDRTLGTELAELAGITDVEGLTLEIFKAKSNVSALTDEQIVRNDYKVFEFSQKLFLDQLETVEQDTILAEKKDALLTAMAAVKQAEGVDLIIVAVTDILKVNTKLLLLGEDEIKAAEQAFGGKAVDNVLDIGAKMSRKKEIVPPLEKVLK